MRIWAISDIHVDFAVNYNWIKALSNSDYKNDALILAGDVTHRPDLLAETFEILLTKFAHLFFVPGNHELWVHGSASGDSFDKHSAVLRLCSASGVHTEPKCFGERDRGVAIVPLFSWYTKPEEGRDSLFVPTTPDDVRLRSWADTYLVKWPHLGGRTPTQAFLDLNKHRIAAAYPKVRISFSHFLPRRELMFASRAETTLPRREPEDFNFSRVAGSTLLDEQIRTLGSTIHVYGHQHRNRRRHYDDVLYVSSCLGYDHERRDHLIDPATVPTAIWPADEPASLGS